VRYPKHSMRRGEAWIELDRFLELGRRAINAP
jgi:hypothetical protein